MKKKLKKLKSIFANMQLQHNKAVVSQDPEAELLTVNYGAWEVSKLGFGSIPFSWFEAVRVRSYPSFNLTLHP